MALPKGSFYGAIGNSTTCSIQGFVITVGLSSIGYYLMTLYLYYYVAICKFYNPVDFRRKNELYCHLFCFWYPLIVTILMEKFGFSGAAYDDDCYCYFVGRNNEQENWEILFIVLVTSLLPDTITAGAVIYCLFSIYTLMKRRYQASLSNLTLAPSSASLIVLKQNALNQAILFSCAVFLLPSNLALLYIPASGYLSGGIFHATLLLMQSAFMPLQGFWLLLIYSRPIIALIRRNDPDLSYFRALVRLVVTTNPVEVMDARANRNRTFASSIGLDHGSAPVNDQQRGNSFYTWAMSSTRTRSISSNFAISRED